MLPDPFPPRLVKSELAAAIVVAPFHIALPESRHNFFKPSPGLPCAAHAHLSQPQNLAAATRNISTRGRAPRRRGHAVPPHRSPGQAMQQHRLAAWKLSEASSLNPGPARAGISSECRHG